MKVPSAAAAQSTQRRAQYISAATQSMAISVNGGTPTTANLTPSSPNCTVLAAGLACTTTIGAPVGTDTFAITLYDGSNGTGNALSSATVTQAIVSGANDLNLITNGVVNNIVIGLSSPAFVVGTPETVSVSVTATDADGDAIVGPGNYAAANGNALTIHLTDSDASGATTLNISSVTAPTAGITLTYTGAALTSATISATVSGGTIAGSITASVFSFAHIYVANRDGSAVLAWPLAGPFGNVAPSTVISGSNTQFGAVDGLAVDTSGNVYAGEDDNAAFATIAYFPAGASGNVAPSLTLTPTPNIRTENLAIDAADNLYVDSWSTAAVDVFAPGASGAAAPSRVISGSNTGFIEPLGVTLYSGNLYVVDYGANAIFVFPATASGNVAPTTIISGAATLLNHPGEVAFDSTGRMIVANTGTACCSDGFVLVFAAGASGNVAPVANISGGNTGLLDPSGVAVDGSGNIWVSDASASAIYRFASTANGNVAPTATISGAATTLSDPQDVTIH